MVPSKNELEIQYQEQKKRYERLGIRVKEILEGLLKKEQLRTLPLIPPRSKTFESFYDKIKRHSITADFFNNIEDIIGVRVVCIYFSDIERIGKIIEDNFEIVRKDRKTVFERVDVFGYLSDHYIVKLRQEWRLPEDEDLMTIKCEIQVRTILMHAWATVSHELDYKKDIRLSEDQRREMHAVSSLLYIADQRFDAYKRAEQEQLKIAAAELSEQAKIELGRPITSENLKDYLQWRFPTRGTSETYVYDELRDQLHALGLKKLETIDGLIMKADKALQEYEKEHPPCSTSGARYDRIGATRICVALTDRQNKDSTSFYVIDSGKFRQMITE